MRNENQTQDGSACGICGAARHRGLFQATDRLSPSHEAFTIAECEVCSVKRTLPYLDNDHLAAYYPEDYWGEEPTLEWISRSQADKLSFLVKCGIAGGTILDVGCGAGYFLRALDGDRWERYGVETGNEAVAIARKHLGEEKIFSGTLLDVASPVPFDVVSFWSSLEHMNDPGPNLEHAYRMLRPGGTVIVQVPNAASYQAEWFRSRWFSWDAPRHRYHYSLRVLTDLLERTGFSVSRTSFHSREHNAHALRQSMKALLWQGSNPIARGTYLLLKPFTTPFDHVMSSLGKGATLTLAATKSQVRSPDVLYSIITYDN